MQSDAIRLLDLSPGGRIGDRYKVVGPHRQGGLSTAYEAIDEETDQRCELQLFPSGLFERRTQAEEFAGTMEPWKRLDCPSIVRVRAILKVPMPTVVLVTDYPRGPSLRERLNTEGRLQPAEVVSIGCDLIEGLVAIHECDLVHGDIKPYTIHVDRNGEGELQASLVDGGITPSLWTAKDLGDKTQLIGTPYYAPIEQFGGDSPDRQSDIYNVSAVLFECLAGKLPWQGKTFLQIFQAKLDKTPPSVRRVAPDVTVPPELERVVARGCLADKKQRYETARGFLDDLAQLA